MTRRPKRAFRKLSEDFEHFFLLPIGVWCNSYFFGGFPFSSRVSMGKFCQRSSFKQAEKRSGHHLKYHNLPIPSKCPLPFSHDHPNATNSIPLSTPPPPCSSHLNAHPSKTNRQPASPTAQTHGPHSVPPSHHPLCTDTILCALTASIPIMQACLPCCVALHHVVIGEQGALHASCPGTL